MTLQGKAVLLPASIQEWDVVKGEQEMVRKTEVETPEAQREERFTSLQPTYEDSVPPDDEGDWDHEG